jgi:osmotically-inducible protein OsmY
MKACIVVGCVLLTGCAAPIVLVGGTAAMGTMSLREKGVTGTFGDTQMSTMISAKMLAENSEMFTQVDVNVQGGEVLLTGFVKDPQSQVEAERIAWSVNGVKAVNNNIKVQDASFTDYVSDCYITSRAKNALLFERDIKSMNYSVKTVEGVIYLMGIAQNQAEHDMVTKIMSQIGGVEKIVSYVRIKGVDPTL